MTSKDWQNRIDELNKDLYSRGKQFDSITTHRELGDEDYGVKKNWGTETQVHTDSPTETFAKKYYPLFKKILWASVGFFFFAILVAVFVFFWGNNSISSNNVDISVAGPVSIAGGDTLSFDITAFNKNNTPLQLADLEVDFPSGTRDSNDITKSLSRIRESMGDIATGGLSKKTVKAILYGEANSTQIIKITVDYRVPGSNAIFYKEKDYSVVISSSPISLTVDSLNEINSGQEIDLNATIVSNSNAILNGVLLSIDYPFGFTYMSSDTKPISGTNVWGLGDMMAGQKISVKIHGKITGQDGEERVFRFTVGHKDDNQQTTIGIPYVVSTQTIAIKKPFIGIQLALNGDSSSDTIYSLAGSGINSDILWSNNTGTKILDSAISLSFAGNALDKTSVTSDLGIYQSLINTIVWDKTKNDSLAEITPGNSGHVSFNFASLSPQILLNMGITKPEIDLSVGVSGNRVNDSGVPETINSTVTKQIKISSNLNLVSKVVFNAGPFANSGPIPPKVETPTTYTVIWSVSNSYNDVSGVVVTATLPPYVKWVGTFDPSSEDVSFNSTDNSVTWNAGDIGAFTGYTSNPKQISFQISFTPSANQFNTSPVLVNTTSFSAKDNWSGGLLSSTKPEMTTRINSDPYFKNGDDMVVQ